MTATICTSLKLIPQYTAPSSWWEHVPIAHWLIEYLKPEVVVELGTHYGVSFFAFCEAARAYSPNTFIYAVDTWEGDSQAGFYNDEVYQKVYAHQQAFHQLQSYLIRSNFDEAANHFTDKSIDILHIDGLHTYESVKHDYETWLPKLREGGSLIFHDWNVREKDFGVWQLWDEIKCDDNYKCIEVPNGHGLGIATLTEEKPVWHIDIENVIPLLTTKGALLNQNATNQQSLQSSMKQIEDLTTHINNLESAVKQLDSLTSEQRSHINNLETLTSEQRSHINNLEPLNSEHSSHISNLESAVKQLDSLTSEQRSHINNLEALIEHHKLSPWKKLILKARNKSKA